MSDGQTKPISLAANDASAQVDETILPAAVRSSRQRFERVTRRLHFGGASFQNGSMPRRSSRPMIFAIGMAWL
jgi:hypothetical protein